MGEKPLLTLKELASAAARKAQETFDPAGAMVEADIRRAQVRKEGERAQERVYAVIGRKIDQVATGQRPAQPLSREGKQEIGEALTRIGDALTKEGV